MIRARRSTSAGAIETVILSGGAPHSPLMAGFLYAFLKRGKMFKTFHTSGAGALMALLTIAPRDPTPEEALLRWSEVGVADLIYRWLPVNFKLFSKPGPWAPLFRKWAQHYKVPDTPTEKDTPADLSRRLHNDWIDLWFSALTPSTLNFRSKGLAAPFPFLEEVVDFGKFKQKAEGRRFNLFVNAYCITTAEMELFGNDKIDAPHVRAALSLPFLYPPGRVDGKDYLEGAAQEPLNFDGLTKHLRARAHSERPPAVVLLDIMGQNPEWLIRVPRDLWDAYVISVVAPIVALAKKELLLFKCRHNDGPRDTWLIDLMEIDFEIPRAEVSKVLEWSYSNLRSLFKIGREQGDAFLDHHGDRVPDRREAGI
ncbi:MAG TPA: patatin-like phospholipase family protein [Methylomirabilota bacterium]